MAQIDRIDREILGLLQNNARLSNKELAAHVHLSQSSCLARVRRLERSGVIQGYQARLALARLGRPLQALIAIQYRDTEADVAQIERFTEELVGLPEALSLFHVTGADDYLLHVAVADTDHLRRLVVERLLRRAEVDRVKTAIIYQHWQSGSVQLGSGR